VIALAVVDSVSLRPTSRSTSSLGEDSISKLLPQGGAVSEAD
jgi:hypothetical protein